MPFESKIPFFIFFRRTLSGAVGLLIYLNVLFKCRFTLASMLNLDIIYTLFFTLFNKLNIYNNNTIHVVTLHLTDEVDKVCLA